MSRSPSPPARGSRQLGEKVPPNPPGSDCARLIALLAQVEPLRFVTVTPYCFVAPGEPDCEIGATAIEGDAVVHSGVLHRHHHRRATAADRGAA